MKKQLPSLLVIVILSLISLASQGQEKRLALVIGNADYLAGPLTNPVNDARSMARALRSAGFEVMLRENVSNQTEMKRVIREYGQKLKEAEVGLFYFAGHGIQVDGFNFLVPVNAVINNEEEVEYECVDAGFVLAQMEAAGNRVNIVVLDACRNNPFARTFRSTQQGLVSMNAPAGSLIAYATSPGKTAMDGTGVNGLYTQELLYQIQRPGLKIEDVFKNVRIEVMRKSNSQQVPWESSSLTGDFYFEPTTEQVADKGTSSTPGTTSMMWKDNKDKLYLYRNNQLIESPSTYPFGNDLIAEDPVTHDRYLLRNYWNNRDNQLRPAEKLPAAKSDYYTTPAEIKQPVDKTSSTVNRAEWKADRSGNFWFFLDGVDVSKKVRITPARKNLWIFDPETRTTYKIENFRAQLDNTLREVLPANSNGTNTRTTSTTPVNKPLTTTIPKTIVWRAERDGTFYLKVDGTEISKETTYKLNGNDLYVFHTRTGWSFILKNFVNRLDNRWRKGLFVNNR